MAQTLIDSGVYDAREVSQLLGQHPSLIVRWSAPDAARRPAIVPPSFERMFSFVDLVSLAVVRELWRRNISEADMRSGVALLQLETGHARPFAHKEVLELLATSGTSLVANLHNGWWDIGKGGQGAFEDILRLYFKSVSYDELGLAQRWRPTPLVLLDPRIQAGAPCIKGTRIPTAVVVTMLAADPPEMVAEDFDLTVEQVQAAADFEAALAAGQGLAA